MDILKENIEHCNVEIKRLEKEFYNNLYSDDLLIPTFEELMANYNLLIDKVHDVIKLFDFVAKENRLYDKLYKNMYIDPAEEWIDIKNKLKEMESKKWI